MRPASIDCHHDRRMFVVRHADPGENRAQRQTRADHGSHAGHGPESQRPSTARYRSLAASDGVTTRKVPAVRLIPAIVINADGNSFNPTRKVPALRQRCSPRQPVRLPCFNPTRKVPAVRPDACHRFVQSVLWFQSDSESSCRATVPPILGGLTCAFARSFQNLPAGAVDKLIQNDDRLRLCKSQGYRSLPEPPRFVGVSEALDIDQGLTA